MALKDIFGAAGFGSKNSVGSEAPAVAPVIPATTPAPAEQPKSFTDRFTSLWQSDPKTDAQPINWKPDIKTDPVKVKAAAAALDFTGQIPKELLEKAAKGDPVAFAQVINDSARLGFERAVEVNANVVNDALTQQATLFKDTVVPRILKDHATTQALRADNSLYENKAAAPMLSVVENQMKIKFPEASPAEITAHAKEFVNGFAQVVVEANGMTVNKPVAIAANKKEVDWDSYFKLPTPQ